MIGFRKYVPWQSLDRQAARLNEEFNRVFGRLPQGADDSFPHFNIFTNTEGAVLVAELPGVTAGDIELTVSGSSVTIKGSRKETEAGDARRVRRERRFGSFVRTFALPFQIDAAKAEAKSRKGILRIDLPRAEADKPKRIAVLPA